MTFLSKIWHDPVWSKIISALILALSGYILSTISPSIKGFLLSPIPLWIVVLIAALIVVLTKAFIHYSKTERMKRSEDKKNQEQKDRRVQEYKDLIWQYFISLEEDDLLLIVDLFSHDLVDPDNEHVRIIGYESHLYERLAEITKIPIGAMQGQNTYRQLIRVDEIGNKTRYTFEFYFYSLLKYYLQTGEKLKL